MPLVSRSVKRPGDREEVAVYCDIVDWQPSSEAAVSIDTAAYQGEQVDASNESEIATGQARQGDILQRHIVRRVERNDNIAPNLRRMRHRSGVIGE